MTTTSFTRGAPGSPLHSWIVDNEAALSTLTLTAEDVNRVARAADTGALYVLRSVSPAVWDAFSPPSFGPQVISGTSYTLVLSDNGKLKQTTNSGAIAITVPSNASVAFEVGRTQVFIEQNGTGALTIAGAGGVTVESALSLTSSAQFQAFTLSKTATNRWLVT